MLSQKCPHPDKTLMSGLLASLLVYFSTPQAPPLHHSLSSVLEPLPVILPSGREEHILDPVPTLFLKCGSIHLQATLWGLPGRDAAINEARRTTVQADAVGCGSKGVLMMLSRLGFGGKTFPSKVVQTSVRLASKISRQTMKCRC